MAFSTEYILKADFRMDKNLLQHTCIHTWKTKPFIPFDVQILKICLCVVMTPQAFNKIELINLLQIY